MYPPYNFYIAIYLSNIHGEHKISIQLPTEKRSPTTQVCLILNCENFVDYGGASDQHEDDNAQNDSSGSSRIVQVTRSFDVTVEVEITAVPPYSEIDETVTVGGGKL
jgi:hypothetical protein